MNRRSTKIILFLALSVLVGAFAGTTLAEQAGGHGMAQSEAATAPQPRGDVLYTCACGEGCSCNAVSKTPGDCKCGKPMAWGHVVRVEGDEALVCTCAEGCTCKQDASDPTKCGCGKTLKRVSLKGTGIYFCNCGGSCACNTLSDQPGSCRCGMNLKQM